MSQTFCGAWYVKHHETYYLLINEYLLQFYSILHLYEVLNRQFTEASIIVHLSDVLIIIEDRITKFP